jgi:predicted DNA-binding transcriptional regulator YafY
VRADRLLSLALLLQARGSATARALAAELGVSVRTIYRDLEALAAAGVPVITESGPGGGCRLMDGYRFPLRGLRAEEAEALLILGVPEAMRELGLDRALDAAHRQIRVTAGGSPAGPVLVHLDMPRWFGSQEEVSCLRELAQALRLGRRLRFRYRRDEAARTAGPLSRNGEPRTAGPLSRGGEPRTVGPLSRAGEPRTVGPLGLANKAGTWYLVAATGAPEPRVFRAGRISSVSVLAEPFERPADFELARFWARWSAEFEASRPRLQVTLRASPDALAVFPEIFGQAAGPVLEAARPAGEDGWRAVTLSFEHELAAAHRLAGFGGQVEILDPAPVRARLLTLAREILGRYDARPLRCSKVELREGYARYLYVYVPG